MHQKEITHYGTQYDKMVHNEIERINYKVTNSPVNIVLTNVQTNNQNNEVCHFVLVYDVILIQSDVRIVDRSINNQISYHVV